MAIDDENGRTEDALSDVLRLIRLSGCVYFQSEFAAPWGMTMDAGPYAQFHVVVRGSCWLTLTGERRRLETGDVVVLATGAAHALSDEPTSPRLPGRQVLEAVLGGHAAFGPADGRPETRLLCGHFEFDRAVAHPLISELPDVIHVRGMESQHPGWLDWVAPILIGETGSGRPGAETIVDRLAEVLLIQVLRAHLLDHQQGQGFLAAIMDRRINNALKVIHAGAGDELTLADIARAAGMSRSSLAGRFKDVMGEAPMAYLGRWRMLQARDLLSTTGLPLADVAERVGYGSEAAFSRAFRRAFAEAPGAFRRAQGP
jgi:AraC-like DNA-binding protein